MAAGNIDYQAVLVDLEARRGQLDAAIAGVKAIVASGGGAITNGHSEGVIRPEDIPSHAFLTLSIADATKKYLGMVKSKQTLPQIMQALERGGLPPAKYSTVYAVLRRRESQVEDIVRMGDEWGLTEWYPNNPNLRKRNKQTKSEPVPDESEDPSVRPVRARLGGRRATGMTIGDGVEKILKEAGTPLHLKVIVERLASMGRIAKPVSVRDTLTRNDSQKRFAALGKNMFTLANAASKSGAASL
jgi:hypothetical protein